MNFQYKSLILIALGIGVSFQSFAKTYTCSVSRRDYLYIKEMTRVVSTELGDFTFDSESKKIERFPLVNMPPLEVEAVVCSGNSGCTGGAATLVTCGLISGPKSEISEGEVMEQLLCPKEEGRWMHLRPIPYATVDIGANTLAFSALHDTRANYLIHCGSK